MNAQPKTGNIYKSLNEHAIEWLEKQIFVLENSDNPYTNKPKEYAEGMLDGFRQVLYMLES